MTNTANKPLDWYAERTAYLTEFMSEERRQVLQRTLDSRTRYMTILTENTYHAQNASALVRHCEAFGIQDIHTVETRCKFNPNVNIVRGTDKWIDLHRHRTTAEAIADLKGAGLSHRGDHASPRRQDSRNVRCRGFPLRAGLRHRARRHLGRDRRCGRRISPHPDVRHGRESQCIGFGGHSDLHALVPDAGNGSPTGV